MDEEDTRQVELTTLAAIYPELHVDEQDQYTVSIELPVSLTNPLTVLFPATSEGKPPIEPSDNTVPTVTDVDSQSLTNLPSLLVRITLPKSYPDEKPPQVSISTSPPWLPRSVLQKLESDAERVWDEAGHDQVVFTYLDEVRQSMDDVFGLVDGQGTLEVSPEHKIAILDYDSKAKQRAFEKETFNCEICLDPKKGSMCHRMLDCGHVFCVQCLQDFYNNAITEGDVASVQCLEPKCAQEREYREAAVPGHAKKQKKAKTFISPSELLQIPLSEDTVKRYVTLKYKNELESDKSTIYCPRSWCQGAARSKKHKKPKDLDFADVSDEGSDVDEPQGKPESKASKKYDASEELLRICEDCDFAFCLRCQQSWHGEFKYCMPKERKEEITEEEKASLDYLKMYTTPCPTCAAPCQKTHGCNHMRCFRCQSHFCYLCSSWLDPTNPYQHFNVQPSGKVNGCFMRLWELESGDGEEAGGAEPEPRMPPLPPPLEVGQHLGIIEAADGRPGGGERGDVAFPWEPRAPPWRHLRLEEADNQQQARPANDRAAVAREGPLVLRIEAAPPPAHDRDAAQRALAPAPGPAVGRGGAQVANERGRGAGRRGRGARRGRGPGINRQNNNNNRGMNPQGPDLRLNNGGPLRARGIGDLLRQEGELEPQQANWIRQFVQLALADQEDLVDDDSDDDYMIVE